MQITSEMIDEKLKLLEQQKQDHFAVYQQAIGAIAALQHIKGQLAEKEKDHLTMEEFESMVGGKIEAIEPV
jgi:hypothetical protein